MIHLLLAIIYISFISLGLPDGLLGSAWPEMYKGFDVPISYAGIISMIISASTVVSALLCERLVKKLGTGLLTALSVATTAIALFLFSQSTQFWHLCLVGIPYGLGAGSVDAALNNFVAIHYKSRQMSWLHCFWGVGCSAGPYILSFFLVNGHSWSMGYLAVFIIQAILSVMLFISLPLWKMKTQQTPSVSEKSDTKPIGLKRTVSTKGVKEVMATFFCYCALESTAGLWAVSYIVLTKGIPSETAAGFGAVFYLGITVGRFLNGFIADKFGDNKMVYIGCSIIAAGITALILPFGIVSAVIGLSLIGLGCAPIYPCVIHSTPARFGADISQAIIGVQMASAYIGITTMPILFGLIADNISIQLFPLFLVIILVLMTIFFLRLNKKAKG
ncbi:MAG: MFS transporter [Ruminococcaceae bacterium]|nr:MFS transporter [Oscillospiraceae bacterium]